MATVKPGSISHRQRQALQTKHHIVQAARKLFADGGYAETSVDAVAAEAGVAARTVYATFGNKKAILAAICEEWLEDAGIRESIGKGLAEKDLAPRLDIVANSCRRQWESERGVAALLEGAAASDAEVARMQAGWKSDRAASLRLIFDGLEAQLRPGVDIRSAGAILRAVTGFEVYKELVVGEGWSPGQYEDWMSGVLKELLLPPNPKSALS